MVLVISKANSQPNEIAIRRRISSIFNKREEDFPSLREYNDYLEEVEDMNIDVPSIEAKIERYQRENAEQIMINQARKAEELAAALAACKGQPANPVSDLGVVGNVGAEPGQYAPTVAGGQPRPIPMAVDVHGYAVDDEDRMRLKEERGPAAGGWSMDLCKRRALKEAFASIWV